MEGQDQEGLRVRSDSIASLKSMLSQRCAKFVAGNIRHCLSAWEKLTSDQEILQTVTGLKVDFEDPFAPLPSSVVSYPSKINAPLIQQEISSLVIKGVLKEVVHVPDEIISPIFLRKKADGGQRMILNLRRLNINVSNWHFKMETIVSILKLIQKDAFMIKLDIKDAYYSVPIDEDHQKFFRFQINDSLYQYTALPNGFSPGPRKFTKLLKPPFAELRRKMILIAGYIDDLISAAISSQECSYNMLEVVDLLVRLGFFINVKKSIFDPSQILEYLGFIIDSVNMIVKLTPIKADRMVLLCDKALSAKTLSIRSVASLLGRITSSLVGVKFGKLHFRGLERCKLLALENASGNYNAVMCLDKASREDILWWRDNVKASFNSFSVSSPSLTISSDACDIGWGAVFKDFRTSGFFSHSEVKLHINVKELLACSFGLTALMEEVDNTHILLLMDNSSAVHALNKMGSMRSLLLDSISKDIWDWANKRNNFLTASHIPGVFNEEADAESRREDRSSEWMLHSQDFKRLLEELQFTPSIDLFASRLNTQLSSFVSFRPDPESCHVDAFSLNWEDLSFYAFPPFPCISSCIQKVVQDRSRGILVAPNWPNQIWYPELIRMSETLPVIFPPRRNLLGLASNEDATHPIWERLPLIGVLISGKL